jgi:ketosteroid isomerase-like protein
MSYRDEMAAINGKYVAAVSRGDTAGIAALFTEEAMAMYANRDFIKGRKEIQKFYLLWQGIERAQFFILSLYTVSRWLENNGSSKAQRVTE